jgi:cephalosporin-C deacetylase-like acetyl esterase
MQSGKLGRRLKTPALRYLGLFAFALHFETHFFLWNVLKAAIFVESYQLNDHHSGEVISSVGLARLCFVPRH